MKTLRTVFPLSLGLAFFFVGACVTTKPHYTQPQDFVGPMDKLASAVDACRYLGGLIVSAVNGAGKETLLAPSHCPVGGYWDKNPLHPAVKAVAEGSFQQKQPPRIRGTGYVVDALEAALWAFHSSSTFRKGLLLAVNLGDDADTTGAIYGQLAGAHYGLPGIPESWQTRVANAALITHLADQLAQRTPL